MMKKNLPKRKLSNLGTISSGTRAASCKIFSPPPLSKIKIEDKSIFYSTDHVLDDEDNNFKYHGKK